MPSFILAKDNKSLTWQAYAFLAFLAVVFFLPGFFTLPPVDRDEPHFAQATKQMIESGDYRDIKFRNDTRYQKPIGIYWLQAASVKLFSPHNLNTIAAYRVPSLVGATLAVVMTAATGSLLFEPMVGFIAAILMICCLLLNVEARLAKTDAALLGCIMVAQYALARAYVNRDAIEKKGWGNALAFWIAHSVGFLIKGPIPLLVTAATIGTLWYKDKNLRWCASLKPLIGLPLALLIIAPWFIDILLISHGDFMAHSAGQDMFAKVWQGQNRGIMPPGLHMLVFPILFFPSSLIALLAIPDIWRHRNHPQVRFCLGWIIPTWIVFELSLTKLPHYLLPTYPAIAILAAKFMLDGFPALTEKRWHWLPRVTTGLWFLIGTSLTVVLVALFHHMNGVWNIPQIAAGIALMIAMAVGLMLLIKQSPLGIAVIAAGSLLFIQVTFGMLLPTLPHIWLAQDIMQTAESVKPCAQVKIISASYSEASLIFLAGTETQTLNDGAAVADAMRHDGCLLGLLDKNHNTAFLDSFAPNEKQPFAVTTIKAPNIGSGRTVELTLYRMPIMDKP